LNGRLIIILANPNPFSQRKVNFIETIFYDELESDDESPMLETLRAPILEDEEEGGTHDLRHLLDRKGKRRRPAPQGPRNVC